MTRTPETQLQLWNDVKKVIDKYYYKFDHTSLMVALCQYVCHYRFYDPPVWSFLLGPSSAGKSSVVIKGISFFKNTHIIDMLTPNSFLSGFGRNNGILPNLPIMFPPKETDKFLKIPPPLDPRSHGVILISDFSTILGLSLADRSSIQAQLRRMFDGSLDRPVGNRATKLEWRGKLTVIAAGVPSVEEFTSIERDLGERFLHYKMPEYDDLEEQSDMAIVALSSLGLEEQFNKEFEISLKQFVGIDNHDLYDNLSYTDIAKYQINKLVAVLTKLRQRVVRDYNTPKRDIIDVGTLENTGRLYKSLIQLAKGNCMLMRRNQLNNEDIKLLKRVGWGCIPTKRKKIVECFLKYDRAMQKIEVEKETELPHMTIHYAISDLVALGVLLQDNQLYELSPDIRAIVNITCF